MKRVICFVLSIILVLGVNSSIVFADNNYTYNEELGLINRDIGLYRFEKVASERTGTEVVITSIVQIEPAKHWIAVVNATNWVQGTWDFALQDTKPEAPAGIRNWYWFCFYDEAYNRLGYVLAIKVG